MPTLIYLNKSLFLQNLKTIVAQLVFKSDSTFLHSNISLNSEGIGGMSEWKTDTNNGRKSSEAEEEVCVWEVVNEEEVVREDVAWDVDGVLWPDPAQTHDAEAESITCWLYVDCTFTLYCHVLFIYIFSLSFCSFTSAESTDIQYCSACSTSSMQYLNCNWVVNLFIWIT